MLLIFDCDGVLIDSERILSDVYRECLCGIGLDLSFEEVVKTFKGRSTKDCLAIVEQMLGRSVSEKELNDRYEELGAERFENEIRPIPWVKQALEKLSLRRCVASSSSHEHIRLGLELSGLLPYFCEGIYSASDVARGKPAPDLFLHAASQMDAAPSDCIVIEDSPAGIEGALTAGMIALGYVDLTSEDELRDAGAETFGCMSQLPGLIDRLSRGLD